MGSIFRYSFYFLDYCHTIGERNYLPLFLNIQLLTLILCSSTIVISILFGDLRVAILAHDLDLRRLQYFYLCKILLS